eukprot:m.906462 g.906462  ORF g.906462 m.906462 type:complete len:983 (+) comp23705_c0_seq4:317-3265(+)
MADLTATSRQALEIVYSHPNSPTKPEAEGWLTALSESDDAWMVAWSLLRPSPENSTQIQFYAANLLLHKVRGGLSSFSLDPVEFREQLIEAAVHFAQCGNSTCCRQLSSAVAAFATHSVPTHWTGVVPSLFTAVGKAAATQGVSDDVAQSCLLQLLTALPEEVFRDADKASRAALHPGAQAVLEELAAERHRVAQLIQMHIGGRGTPSSTPHGSPSSATSPVSTGCCQVDALKCLAVWMSRSVLHVADMQHMLDTLMNCLRLVGDQDPPSDHQQNISRAALECMDAVALSTEWQTHHLQLLLPLARYFLSLEPLLRKAIAQHHWVYAGQLCHVLSTFVQTNLDHLLDPADGRLQALFALLHLTQQCLTQASHYSSDDTLSDVATKLWINLIPRLVGSKRQSQCRASLLPCMKQLIHVIVMRAATPMDPALVDDVDETTAYNRHQKELGEITGMACFFLKRPAVERLLDILTATLHQAKAPQGDTDQVLRTLKAVLGLLGQTASMLSLCDCDDIMRKTVCSLPQIKTAGERNVGVLRALVTFIGQLAEWLKGHVDLCLPATNIVVQTLWLSDDVLPAAAEALASLCEHVGPSLHELLPIICGPEFMKLTNRADKSTVSILRATALLIKTFDPDTAAKHLRAYVIPHLNHVGTCAANASSRAFLLTALDSAAKVIAALERPDCEALSLAAFHVVWNGLQLTLRNWAQDEDVVDAAVECICTAIDTCCNTCDELLPDIAQQCIECFSVGCNAELLDAVSGHMLSILRKVPSDSPQAGRIAGLFLHATDTARRLLSEYRSGTGQRRQLNTAAVRSYLALMAKAARLMKHVVFLQHELPSQAFSIAVDAVDSIDRTLVKASCDYIKNTLSAARDVALAASVVHYHLGSLLAHIVSGIASDVDRGSLPLLASVLESLNQTLLEGDTGQGPSASALHQNLEIVLSQLTTVSAEMRQSFGAAVVARPCSLDHLTRQVEAFASLARRKASA